MVPGKTKENLCDEVNMGSVLRDGFYHLSKCT
jgi:hypothetical protein